MFRSKGFWSFLKLVTGIGFLFSIELLILLHLFF